MKKDINSKLHYDGTQWLDSENDRPESNQEIIFIDAIGMYKGIFHTIRNGVVYVNGKIDDVVEWENIYEWIPYPKR